MHAAQTTLTQSVSLIRSVNHSVLSIIQSFTTLPRSVIRTVLAHPVHYTLSAVPFCSLNPPLGGFRSLHFTSSIASFLAVLRSLHSTSSIVPFLAVLVLLLIPSLVRFVHSWLLSITSFFPSLIRSTACEYVSKMDK